MSDRFDCLITARAPERLKAAIEQAAGRKMTSGSEYVRQAILGQLRSDGIEPSSFINEATAA